MTPSPGLPRPAVGRRRWAAALSGVVLAGLATGCVIVALTPVNLPGGGPAGATAVQTRVAGISIERSSVDGAATDPAPETSPTTVAATDPAPAVASPPETVAPTTTAAPPIAAPAVSRPEAVRTEVLAAISFPWQQVLPGWTIEFLPERKGYRGSTFPDRKVIQIYLRDELTIADYVHVTAHELGHAVDVTLLDEADHERWNETRGRDADARWWVESGADDFSSGAGDWAECFAWSQLPSGRFYSQVGRPPDADQLAVMAEIILAAGG